MGRRLQRQIEWSNFSLSGAVLMADTATIPSTALPRQGQTCCGLFPSQAQPRLQRLGLLGK